MAVVGLASCLYLLAAAAMFLFQRRLIYPGQGSAPVPLERLAGYHDVALRTADGLSLRGAYRPSVGGRPTIVFFHGNGDSLAGAELATHGFMEVGYGVLLPEYRGYGGNAGEPSEEGLYADGRAALDFLARAGCAPAHVILIGNSLGSGIAVQLAGERRTAALVVVSGFTSLLAVAALHVRWLPVRWLMRDRYDNRSKIGSVEAPTLLLHGTADRLIPLSMAETLASNGRHATVERFPGAGHELAYRPEAQEAVLRWLRSRGLGT